MSLRKPTAFSMLVFLLVVGSRTPALPTWAIPELSIDGIRSSSLATAREERGSPGKGAVTRIRAYSNPIYTDPNDRFSKDPTVVKHEGKFYMYYFGFTLSGRQAIKVASSSDLVHWLYEGAALEARHDGEWDSDLIWAADVAYRDGLFYMYYTGGRRGPDGEIDWSTMRIGLALGREPAGKFVRFAPNPILTPPFGNGVIDAEFFSDDDGRDYLYYVVQAWSSGHWEGIRVRRIDGMVRSHDDRKVIDPTVDWEAGIVEAPTVFKADGYYFLLYSGGGSEHHQRIGYAFSRSPTISSNGGDQGWTKYPSDSDPQPLIDFGDRWADLAVGSTSLVLGPDRHIYVAFQGKNSLDGKFQLGMARLLLDGRAAAARFTQ